jgi:hypothetical protein
MAKPPQITDSEGESYFSGKSANGTLIYIGPITSEQLREAGIQGSSTGYYLCEFDGAEPAASVSVLAPFVSVDAAYRFAQILGLHKIGQPLASFEEPIELGDLSCCRFR